MTLFLKILFLPQKQILIYCTEKTKELNGQPQTLELGRSRFEAPHEGPLPLPEDGALAQPGAGPTVSCRGFLR